MATITNETTVTTLDNKWTGKKKVIVIHNDNKKLNKIPTSSGLKNDTK